MEWVVDPKHGYPDPHGAVLVLNSIGKANQLLRASAVSEENSVEDAKTQLAMMMDIARYTLVKGRCLYGRGRLPDKLEGSRLRIGWDHASFRGGFGEDISRCLTTRHQGREWESYGA